MKLVPVKTNEATGRPWRIQDADSGAFLDGPPMTIEHPDLGPTRINGQRFFERKRDVLTAIYLIEQGLADGSIRWRVIP